MTKRESEAGQRSTVAASVLDKLIEEAIVDCHDESEQIAGFYTMLEENLGLPFETYIFGVQVAVKCLDLTDREEIVAICMRGGTRQPIPILDLPLPVPPPLGAEWIEAYRRWTRRD